MWTRGRASASLGAADNEDGPPGTLPMRTQLTITAAVGIALASVAVVGGQRLGELDRLLRESRLEAAGEAQRGAAKLARDLAGLQEDRAGLVREIARLEGELEALALERRVELADLRDEFLGAQERLQGLLSSSTDQLTVLESSVSRIEGAEYASLIQDLSADLRVQWTALEAQVQQAHGQLEDNRAELAALDRRVAEQRDLDRMWRGVMGPVVQLCGDVSVGSGVLLPSAPLGGSDQPAFRTLVLTAWHVVRDIQGDQGLDHPVPVTLYDRIGAADVLEASVVAHDVDLDLCLLELDTRAFVTEGAKLPSPDRMARARVFEPIYAVGCPLGNDPVPSRGEVSDTSHLVDGKNYWMINAPTFIGNSGGGIFDAGTHELLGIFSKIYNYGSSGQTIIPHMGLVTPMDVVYRWVEETGLDLSAP